jgi:hypothetical protein
MYSPAPSLLESDNHISQFYSVRIHVNTPSSSSSARSDAQADICYVLHLVLISFLHREINRLTDPAHAIPSQDQPLLSTYSVRILLRPWSVDAPATKKRRHSGLISSLPSHWMTQLTLTSNKVLYHCPVLMLFRIGCARVVNHRLQSVIADWKNVLASLLRHWCLQLNRWLGPGRPFPHLASWPLWKHGGGCLQDAGICLFPSGLRARFKDDWDARRREYPLSAHRYCHTLRSTQQRSLHRVYPNARPVVSIQ